MAAADLAIRAKVWAKRYGPPAAKWAAGLGLAAALLWPIEREEPLPEEIERAAKAIYVPPSVTKALQPPVLSVVSLQKGTCVPDVQAFALATAVVELEIRATCDAGQRVDIQHDGLRIAAILDDFGNAILTLPALSAAPVYAITVQGREAVQIDGTPLDFAGYRRAVLLAAPEAGFELHAYEAGATFGEAGHVWSELPYDPIRALVGRGGFLARAGTPSLMGSKIAQIYTVPSDTDVAVSLEAVVTEANCGRDIEALTIRPTADGHPVMTPWQVAMPDCEAIGEVIILGDLAD